MPPTDPELQPHSPGRLPGPPAHFDPAALAALQKMALDCGTTIYRMPSSCEMYLRQYLGRFEIERQALSEGLRRDVPGKIHQFSGPPERYEEYLVQLAQSYDRKVKVGPEVAWWVIAGWAMASGRPLGAVPPVPRFAEAEEPIGPPGPRPVIGNPRLRQAMSGIVGAGGFFGGLVGIAVPFLIVVVGNMVFPAEPRPGIDSAEPPGVGLIVGLSLVGAVTGGAGAAAGWWVGRGSQLPWFGFIAAFAATAATGSVVGFCFGPTHVITWAVMVMSGFGAANAVSSRSGSP